MKTFTLVAAAAAAITLTACNQSDNRTTADQTADTNQSSVNRVRADAPDASIDVRVNTEEIGENIREAAGATRDALERAGQKIRVETRDFADRVSNELREDPKVGASTRNVDISSSNGRVTLQGTVGTEAEKQEVERKIREITDATQIDNQLRVSSDKR